MAKRTIICVSSLIIIGFTLIVVVPIQLISISLPPYGIIDKSLNFPYELSSPFPIEKLYINADEGNVEIRYIEPDINLDYYSMIEVNLMMIGVNIGGKSYEDYFNIQWDHSCSPANFTIKIISDDWYKDSLWVKKELNIVVYLRKDIVFDISVVVKEGNVDISIPYMVSVKNLEINTIKGNILFDLTHCILQGNITGNSIIGDFNIFVNNILCTQNVTWNFTSQDGGLDIKIYQDIEMGANITSTIAIETLNLIYIDKLSNIGALFIFPLTVWDPQGKIVTDFNVFLPSGDEFYLISSDFPARSNFNLIFSTRLIYYDLEIRNNII
ncbi:MAG: hypothetical protein ACFFKA_06765 [Candidatus Thorarchaeota archaeon]